MQNREKFAELVEKQLNEQVGCYIESNGQGDLKQIATCLNVLCALRTMDQVEAQLEVTQQMTDAVKNIDLSKIDLSSIQWPVMPATKGDV